MSKIKEVTGSCSPFRALGEGPSFPLPASDWPRVPGLAAVASQSLPPLSHCLSLSSHHVPLLIYKDTSHTRLDFI